MKQPMLLYDQLAEVAEDFYLTISRCALTPIEQCALEALWVRLDDLVEQLPAALRYDVLTSAEIAMEMEDEG